MGTYSVAGAELKKMIKAAKKEPVNFGFSPASDDAASYCGMHRTKSAALIGKEAKDEGEGTKHTFGTASVAGKMVTLIVSRDIPNLAKKFKRFLKANQVMLNVQVMDEDGNLLDSDVEEGLPDDPELQDEEAGEVPPGAPPAAPETTGAPVDPAALLKRLAELRARIGALPPDLASRLEESFRQVVELAKAGDAPGASAGADRIEAVLARLGQASPAAPAAPEGDLAKLRQAVAAMREKAGGLTDAAMKTPILGALDQAEVLIGNREAEQALAILKKVQALFARLASAAAPAGGAAEWEKRRAALEPEVNRALSQGLVADVDGLRKLWTWAVSNAAEGAVDKALATLPRIEEMLKATAGGFADGIAPDVQPFAKARVIWSDARALMFGEIRKLESEILAACAGDEIEGEVAQALPLLSGHVERLDVRLENKMDQIVNAPAGEARDKLKGEARALIEEYRAVLQEEFFADVDQASGFGSYAVAATATAALGQIAAAIA